MTYGQLGAWVALGLAVLTALVTMSLLGIGCGENKDPCTSTSGPVLAVFFSWVGIVGVLATILLARFGSTRLVVVTAGLTAAAYGGWLVSLIE